MSAVAFDLLQKYAPFVAEHLVTVNATTAQNQLYGGIDLYDLTWLERKWAAYYIWMGNPLLATGLLSFLMHEVSRYHHALLCFVLIPGGLLWPCCPMAHHRCDPILQPVENSAGEPFSLRVWREYS